jgi:hypothetical protein
MRITAEIAEDAKNISLWCFSSAVSAFSAVNLFVIQLG